MGEKGFIREGISQQLYAYAEAIGKGAITQLEFKWDGNEGFTAEVTLAAPLKVVAVNLDVPPVEEP
jgi:hypothetical protein